MGKADFTGVRPTAPAHQCHVRNGVVRGTERTHTHKPAFRRQLARHAVNLGYFQGFLKIKRWQDSGQTAGQHSLATARRPDKQNIVAPGCGHLQGALRRLLPLYLGIIHCICRRSRCGDLQRCQGLQRSCPGQKCCAGCEIFRRIDIEPARHDRLSPIARRHNKPLGLSFPGQQSQRQHAAHWPQGTIEGKFTRQIKPLQPLNGNNTGSRQEPYRQRQVKTGTVLAAPSRCQVDRNARRRQPETTGPERGKHTVLCFAHSGLSQTNHGKTGQALAHIIHFQFHGVGVNAFHSATVQPDDHAASRMLLFHGAADTLPAYVVKTDP